MKIQTSNEISKDNSNHTLIAGIYKERLTEKGISEDVGLLGKEVADLASKVLSEEKYFKGNPGETLSIRLDNSSPAKKLILVGLGNNEEKFDSSVLREATTSAIKKAEAEHSESVSTVLHLNAPDKLHIADATQSIIEASNFALYKFNKYKSGSGEQSINTLTFINPEDYGGYDEDTTKGIQLGIVTSGAQELARNIASEPSDSMPPEKVADITTQIAKANDLEIEILDKGNCKRLGMGSFLAVAQGSNNPPQFVVMRYIPKGTPKEKIVIIGKGVTFDSGGLSIKTADGMETMKCDKSGAAAVIGVMSTMKALNPRSAITMIAPLVENMTGGSAIKPGAIVKAMNGKTIEILNTDAEGRLILADAIAYAVLKEKPDKIIDMATLTGACVVALGDDIAGVMSNDDELAKLIVQSGYAVGEPMWHLPVSKKHRESIKSKVADMKNMGSKGQAGAQAGYALLEQFVKNPATPEAPDIPLGHIDIAGPAWPKSDPWPTGFGTRTLIHLITNS